MSKPVPGIVLVTQMRDRARFCRDRGEIETPELLEQASDHIERLTSALNDLQRINRRSITGAEAREAWRKANAALSHQGEG